MKYKLLFTFLFGLLMISTALGDTLRVACIGNSITEGATLTSPSRDAYPALLNSILGPDYEARNYGVGGRVLLKSGDYPIWDELAFKRAIEFDPDIVTIMLGTNDSKPWNWEDHKNEFVPDYIDMINTFRALDNNARFMLAYPPPAFSNLGSIRDSVIRNEIIPLIDSVASVTGTQVVDFYNSMINDSNLFPDGIHPNAAGHEKIAAIFKPVIEELPAVIDTLPTWFTGVPAGVMTIYDSAAALINVQTAGVATVKYSAADKSYESMEYTFNQTGGREHQTLIYGEHGQTYTYFLRAKDAAGNVMDTSATVSFTFDTTKVLYNWTEFNYPDSVWNNGPALFGNSFVSNTKSVLNDVQTVYFRKSFLIEDKSSIVGIGILIKGQSGAVVYLNGHEIEKVNMPDKEEIVYDDYAEESLSLNKMVVINAANGIQFLKSGQNMVAVEMHTSSASNAPLSFDAQLIDNTNKIYFALGSEWTWFDQGWRPEDMLIEKTPQTFIESDRLLPAGFMLYQNYPNPFNPVTTISYMIPARQKVCLRIYDIRGLLIDQPVNEIQNSGLHKVDFNAGNLSSGIYFYRVTAGGNMQVKSMLLIK